MGSSHSLWRHRAPAPPVGGVVPQIFKLLPPPSLHSLKTNFPLPVYGIPVLKMHDSLARFFMLEKTLWMILDDSLNFHA